MTCRYLDCFRSRTWRKARWAMLERRVSRDVKQSAPTGRGQSLRRHSQRYLFSSHLEAVGWIAQLPRLARKHPKSNIDHPRDGPCASNQPSDEGRRRGRQGPAYEEQDCCRVAAAVASSAHRPTSSVPFRQKLHTASAEPSSWHCDVCRKTSNELAP